MDVALELLAVAAIVAGNAFFVIAEYAIVTARRSALETRAAAGSRGAAAALRLMDDPVRVIGAVQIAITGLGILLGAVGEPAVRGVLGDAVPSWVAFALAFLAVTYLSVALGGLVPKALALHAAERVAVAVARPIDLFARAVTPGVWVLQVSARVVLRPLGVPDVTAGERVLTIDELRGAFQDAEEQGTLEAETEDMLTGVIDLRLRQAQDVMRPWDDVVAVQLDEPAEAALERMLGAAHSRFPALDGDVHVTGIVHARDAWTAWRAAGEGADDLDLRALVRPAPVVPPTVRVDALLRSLRRERQQLAVVVDEYGRPNGIVTLEDILEEIVGEIEDEFSELDERFERVADGEWLVDASVSISDFNGRTGAALDAGRARSLGGIVFEHLGRMPSEGEDLDVDGVPMTVTELDGHRIARLRARVDA